MLAHATLVSRPVTVTVARRSLGLTDPSTLHGLVTSLAGADAAGTLRLHSRDGAVAPLVVIASERISEEPGWEEVHPGELIHVGPDLAVDRETILSGPPAHPMVLSAREQETQRYD